MGILLCLSALALVCSGCAQVGPLPIVNWPVPPDPQAQLPALETRIAALIQGERTTLDPGAPVLTIDNELVGVARERSTDMAKKNYVANKSPTGETSASLIMSEDATFQGLLGENIAAQQFDPTTEMDVNAMAQRFVDTWMASPAHKENLSFKYYTRTGVGAAIGNGTIYVTELFASDMGLKPPADAGKPESDQPDTQKPGDAQPAVKAPDKRTITELPHPDKDDAKPPAPPYIPDPRPSITQ